MKYEHQHKPEDAASRAYGEAVFSFLVVTAGDCLSG
jgi:hypothetical protein